MSGTVVLTILLNKITTENIALVVLNVVPGLTIVLGKIITNQAWTT